MKSVLSSDRCAVEVGADGGSVSARPSIGSSMAAPTPMDWRSPRALTEEQFVASYVAGGSCFVGRLREPS
jgi:hypothetical protein